MTECTWTDPIYVSQEDQLTDETARQILEHNEKGAEVCGWGSNQEDEDNG